MPFSLTNFTGETLHCYVAKAEDPVSLSAGATNQVEPTKSGKLTLKDKEKQREFTFKIPRGFNKSALRRLDGKDSPWKVYTYGEAKTAVLPVRNMKAFLGDIPNDRKLSDLCLPGELLVWNLVGKSLYEMQELTKRTYFDSTHQGIGSSGVSFDRMALYGWPTSQCQDTPLYTQLENGIRMIDVRLSIDKTANELKAYHGIFPQRTPWSAILDDLRRFLSEQPTETVVVSLKQEDVGQEQWNKLLVEGIEKSQRGWGMWFIDGRLPKLGEVRGKCVMFSRFGPVGYPGEKGWGIHPTTWPNSLKGSFEWNCGDTIVRTQDW